MGSAAGANACSAHMGPSYTDRDCRPAPAVVRGRTSAEAGKETHAQAPMLARAQNTCSGLQAAWHGPCRLDSGGRARGAHLAGRGEGRDAQ